MKFIILMLSLLLTTTVFSQDMRQLVQKTLNSQPGNLPYFLASDYRTLQKTAMKGDQDAQKKLFSVIADHFEDVYASLERNNSLLFSLRRMEKGMYDTPSNNYAENIEALFEKTTEQVTVNKRGLKITTLDGEEKLIDRIKYQDKDKTIKIQHGEEEFVEIPLASLADQDRLFVTSALIDDAFKSDLEVSVEDSNEMETEERTSGRAPIVRTIESIDRYIILENEGEFPINNLLVEYQSFLEQALMDLSKDLPEDYALVGYSRIDSIEPDEQIRIKLPVPAVLQERTEETTSNGITYFHKSPPGTHPRSEGDIGGTWVKIHRITPYGEHLEISKKFKSGSKKWNNVVPLSMKFD